MSLLSLRDLTDEDLEWIVTRGSALAQTGCLPRHSLAGQIVGIFFTQTSTRTRTAFSTAALRLGAGLVTFGPEDLQIATGESLEDTGEVLGRMVDALVIRTAADPVDLEALSGAHRMPVINAMNAAEHPTQALCDLTFLHIHFERLQGLRLLYVGEGNSTATALCLAFARLSGSRAEFRTPPGYGIPTEIWRAAQSAAARSGAEVTERHDLDELPASIEIVYTTRWQTTGTSKRNPNWRSNFVPFRVNKSLMARYPEAIFMHDLPAHRGEEVEASVIDGPVSVVFDQAACKMYSAMAVLEWTLRGVGTQ